MAVNLHKDLKPSSKLNGAGGQDSKGVGEQNRLWAKALLFMQQGFGPTDYRNGMIPRSWPFERSMIPGYDRKVHFTLRSHHRTRPHGDEHQAAATRDCP